MIRDRETEFVIKETLRHKRDMESGKEPFDRANFPDGTRFDGKHVELPGGAFIGVLGMLLFTPVGAAIAYGIIDGLIRLATSEYLQPTILAYLLVPFMAVVLGGLFYWIREHLNSPPYALAEIGIGMATAAQFLRDGEALVRVLAFLAGLRIIVDGISRYVKFSALAKEKSAK